MIMGNGDLYYKILEIVMLVFPSLVTLLILINRRFYMKNLNILKDRFDIFETKTQNNTRVILTKIDQQQKKLSKLLQNKTVAERIRQITKHAIEYCGNSIMSKVLTNSTQNIIDFSNSVLDEGFGNQVKQQLIARLDLTRDVSLEYIGKFISEQNAKIWYDMQRPVCQAYRKAIIEIYEDPINDKNSRFLIKTEDWVQTLTREFITFASILKRNGELICNL